MKRKKYSYAAPCILVEALEPRIAPAGLLNESKFTSATVGTPILLDASGGPSDFQGISTGPGGSGAYLLYITSGKALVYTSDLNGNGKLDPGEITGISAGVDSQGRPLNLILFSDVHGDIATNLLPGEGVSNLTNSSNNPTHGDDGRILLDNSIGSITIRTVTAADLNASDPTDTVANRLALTSFSIYGNIYTGGNFGGLTIDTSGVGALAAKFPAGSGGLSLYTGADPQVGSIYTGSAASFQSFHFTQQVGTNVQGTFLQFTPPAGEHGGDISNVQAAAASTTFDIGTLETGDGGIGARGGNISDVTLHGDHGAYSLIAGNGGPGGTGSSGGSIVDFNDLGTVTGSVTFHTGNGGAGLLGAGGPAGTATFASAAIAADVTLFLGNGGDGFTQGGNGAGLANATFAIPNGVSPVGGKVITTYHAIGDIGNEHPNPDGTYSPQTIDFNGDGIPDAVFTTTNPDQIVILIGSGKGNGDFLDASGEINTSAVSETIYLDAPYLSAQTLVVGDFNGDGKPDIAVASADPLSAAGVYVFLNQIGDSVTNPLGAAANFTKNPLGAHPFSAPLQSALPSLADEGFYQGTAAVTALTTGDFNGDGIMDIGYVQQVTEIGSSASAYQAVGMLFGAPALSTAGQTQVNAATGHFEGSGYFYANPAAPATASGLQVSSFQATTPAVLRSSSILSSSINQYNETAVPGAPNATGVAGTPGSPEVFFYAANGQLAVSEFSIHTNTDKVTGVTTPVFGATVASLSLGDVDTNRAILDSNGNPAVSPAQATALDISVQDVNGDGVADVLVLTQSPESFLVAFEGSAIGTGAGSVTGTFSVASNPGAADKIPGSPGNNAGILLSGPNPTYLITALVAVDPYYDGLVKNNTDPGRYNDIAFLEFDPPGPAIHEVSLSNGAGAVNFYAGGSGVQVSSIFIPDSAVSSSVSSFDAYYQFVPAGEGTATVANPAPPLHQAVGYAALTPSTGGIFDTPIDVFTALAVVDTGTGTGTGAVTTPALPAFSAPVQTFTRLLTDNGIKIFSGSGGNSTVGAGGDAGVLGTSLTTTTAGDAAGSLSIVFPSYGDYAGEAFLSGGHGGNGFTGGGIGGDIVGVSTRGSGTSNAELAAGNGGNGVSGDGGRGGSLSELSILDGTFFTAGNGGTGLRGGAGGSILGNVDKFYDTTTANVTLITGAGGLGALGGGAGGNITGWDPVLAGAFGGSLTYLTGAGGNTAGGTGGAGGNITNSSPDSAVNTLGGNITLDTGAGGSGLIGGAGGAIVNFVNQPTDPSAIPDKLDIVSGAGGIGVSGTGGAGGLINNVQVNATGLASGSNSALSGLVRVLAGNGGASYSGMGGAGGAITNSTLIATSTPIVVAAGAGGAGLTAGGVGGDVSGSVINSAAQQFGKVLIIAGAGGDALAATRADIVIAGDPNTGDLAHALLAFGGASGQAGNGGNVTNITQPVSVATGVDIIAGDGGSTPNSGSSLDTTTGVGIGGSVEGISLAGTVGSISDPFSGTYPPILAYNDTTGTGVVSETITQFVANSFAGTVDTTPLPVTDRGHEFIPNMTALTTLTDANGNVGIVAGAAGRLKGDEAAANGVYGSVQNVSASSILSIVAGSVDRVAPVQVLSGIVVTNVDGVLGADRSLPGSAQAGGPNGVLDYYDTNGNDVQNLEAGYRLIDGAIFATVINQPAAPPLIAGPRVFSPAQG